MWKLQEIHMLRFVPFSRISALFVSDCWFLGDQVEWLVSVTGPPINLASLC